MSKGMSLPKRCESCRRLYEEKKNRKNQVYTTICCSNCGRHFDITYGEYDFYMSKGMSLPKRCEFCRIFR